MVPETHSLLISVDTLDRRLMSHRSVESTSPSPCTVIAQRQLQQHAHIPEEGKCLEHATSDIVL